MIFLAVAVLDHAAASVGVKNGIGLSWFIGEWPKRLETRGVHPDGLPCAAERSRRQDWILR